jgi:glycosyltransferase involved in cell wall biosynthesis
MKISIVTPSYNQGQFIARTLKSVAIQKSSDYEVEHVVFDGGSTDNTVDVLRSFGDQIRWISKKDKGQTDAVNQGIKATDGEIIGWLNSDDVYYPDAFETVVAFFKSHPEVDIVYGAADHIGLDDVAFEEYPTEAWSFDRLKETCFICQPALFFRRRVVTKYGALDENLNYCMDYAYWLMLGMSGAVFAYLPHKLAGSRLYADNKTLGSRVKVHAEINSMFKKLLRSVPDRWIFNYAHAKVEPMCDKLTRPRVFVAFIAMTAVMTSLFWNKKISVEMLTTIKRWFEK